MIIKSSVRGSSGLGVHLASEANEVARVTGSSGILGGDPPAAVGELAALGAGSRTRNPLVHASINPDQPLTDAQWRHAWRRWEEARGLKGQPYLEVEHVKHGRAHRHRVYCRVDVERGVAIRQSHERVVNERVSRQLELTFGHQVTRGAHSRAVLQWAEQHGDRQLADAVREHARAPRPEAAMDHKAWRQQERTGVSGPDVAAAAAEAWQRSDDDKAFRAALAEQGLALAQGRKTPQLVDAAGATHDLRRTLRGGGAKVTAAEVRSRITDLLPSVDQVIERREAERRPPERPQEPRSRPRPGDAPAPQRRGRVTAQQALDELRPALEKTTARVQRLERRVESVNRQVRELRDRTYRRLLQRSKPWRQLVQRQDRVWRKTHTERDEARADLNRFRRRPWWRALHLISRGRVGPIAVARRDLDDADRRVRGLAMEQVTERDRLHRRIGPKIDREVERLIAPQREKRQELVQQLGRARAEHEPVQRRFSALSDLSAVAPDATVSTDTPTAEIQSTADELWRERGIEPDGPTLSR